MTETAKSLFRHGRKLRAQSKVRHPLVPWTAETTTQEMVMRCCKRPMQPFYKKRVKQGLNSGFRCRKCSGVQTVDPRDFTKCDLCGFWVISDEVHRTPEIEGGDSIDQCSDCAEKIWEEPSSKTSD